MFDKKQKTCVKRIHLVTDHGLYDRKAFYTVKIVFYSSSKNSIFLYFLEAKNLSFVTKNYSKSSYICVSISSKNPHN